MNKILSSILLSLVLLFVFGVIEYPDNRLHVVMCDVGQGDSMLIYRRFSQILIDGGANDETSDCISEHIPWFDSKIEMVVMTHPQEDHMKGLVEVVENYEIGLFLSSGGINDTNTFWELKNVLFSRGVEMVFANFGDAFLVGDIKVLVKWPDKESATSMVWSDVYSREDWKILNESEVVKVLGTQADDPNEESVVLEVIYDEISVLTTGDIGVEQEQALLGLGVITPVNVLKVPHHGSKHSSSLEFLEATRPKWALISVGENNRFGHPSGDVLMHLDTVGAKILRTDENGSVELVSDGKKIWIGN